MAYRAYTVDGRGTLAPGLILTRLPTRTVDPPALREFVGSWFPEGVSPHGETYLLQATPNVPNPVDPGVELVCELMRRAEFPHAPSRLECMFGSETIQGAREFRAAYRSPDARIFEVECDERPFRADMKTLDIRSSAATVAFAAHHYWSQKSDAYSAWGIRVPPSWELLLPLPARVVERVE